MSTFDTLPPDAILYRDLGHGQYEWKKKCWPDSQYKTVGKEILDKIRELCLLADIPMVEEP